MTNTDISISKNLTKLFHNIGRKQLSDKYKPYNVVIQRAPIMLVKFRQLSRTIMSLLTETKINKITAKEESLYNYNQ